jgi:hypothetical protein
MSVSVDAHRPIHSQADPDAMMTTAALAVLCGVSSRTPEAWRLKGIGPPYFEISSRCVRYKRSDVIAWLANFRHEHPGQVA